jgi:hypothetical protein
LREGTTSTTHEKLTYVSLLSRGLVNYLYRGTYGGKLQINYPKIK